MDKFEIKHVTDEIISKAAADWLAEVGEDVFQIEFERFFTVTLPASKDMFYAISIPGNAATLAFVEIISSKHALKTKLVRISVQPSLLPLEAQGNQKTLVDVYLEGIRATFELAALHGASEVKIYGRTDHLYGILKDVQTILDSAPLKGFKHILENRWLSFYSTVQ